MTTFIAYLVLLLFFTVILILFLGIRGIEEPLKPLSNYPPKESQIMQGAEPFFWEGNSEKAFLLLHDLLVHLMK